METITCLGASKVSIKERAEVLAPLMLPKKKIDWIIKRGTCDDGRK